MKSVKEILTLGTEFLTRHGCEQPRYSVECLLADVLRLSRLDLYMHVERLVIDEELRQIRSFLQRRKLGEPVPYILGSVCFSGLCFEIGPGGLIPRVESELLLEDAFSSTSPHAALDLCCGSGCLAICMKKNWPQTRVFGSDISADALFLAKKNGQRHKTDIVWVQGDGFEGLPKKTFDLVVCNPPYISDSEWNSLSKEVRDFEPEIALRGGEGKGLHFFKKFIAQLPDYLYVNAKVYFEVGYRQGAEVKSLLEREGFSQVLVHKDFSGHDRFVSAFFVEGL